MLPTGPGSSSTRCAPTRWATAGHGHCHKHRGEICRTVGPTMAWAMPLCSRRPAGRCNQVPFLAVTKCQCRQGPFLVAIMRHIHQAQFLQTIMVAMAALTHRRRCLKHHRWSSHTGQMASCQPRVQLVTACLQRWPSYQRLQGLLGRLHQESHLVLWIARTSLMLASIQKLSSSAPALCHPHVRKQVAE